jgi:hypothetical protein
MGWMRFQVESGKGSLGQLQRVGWLRRVPQGCQSSRHCTAADRGMSCASLIRWGELAWGGLSLSVPDPPLCLALCSRLSNSGFLLNLGLQRTKQKRNHNTFRQPRFVRFLDFLDQCRIERNPHTNLFEQTIQNNHIQRQAHRLQARSPWPAITRMTTCPSPSTQSD